MPEPDPINYLQSIMVDNKAKGIFAQAYFEEFILGSRETKSKYMDGCWIFSPKGSGSEKRMCFFVHGTPNALHQINAVQHELEGNRTFQALAGALSRAGLGVFYVIPGNFNDGGVVTDWGLLRYKNEKMVPLNPRVFLGRWPGSRGRPSRGNGSWTPQTLERFRSLSDTAVNKTLMIQQFYNEFLKRELRKSVDDPYDADCFIVSYGGRMFPIEIKEKFPYTSQHQQLFGIDAGRVLMMLRLCLPSKSNAFYVIREVDENRRFVKWKHTTLDKIIMNCGWNLQAGGRGMGGGDTQTIPIPYKYFEDTTPNSFEESVLESKAELSQAVREHAKKMLLENNLFCDNLLRDSPQ